MVVLQSVHVGISDISILDDAAAFDLFSVRSASLHVERRHGLLSPRGWLSYTAFLALKSALLLGGRLGKTVSRLSAPVRERGASTGGLTYALSAASALATAPLVGTTIAVRKTAAIATAHDVTALGEDGLASRVLLTIPHVSVRSGSHQSSTSNHRIWLVSAELGTAAPDAAAQRLVAWMAAARRAPPSLSAALVKAPRLALHTSRNAFQQNALSCLRFIPSSMSISAHQAGSSCSRMGSRNALWLGTPRSLLLAASFRSLCSFHSRSSSPLPRRTV